MARGGKRAGTPGKSYPQRSDMHQAVKVAPGQPYGQAQELAQAQRAVPLPNTQNVPPPMSGSAGLPGPADPGLAGPSVMLPGQQPFLRPSERPDEPVTAGLPTGPGPGPEILGQSDPMNDPILHQLTALYQASHDPDLLKVLELRVRYGA